jgi:hypothetical protein
VYRDTAATGAVCTRVSKSRTLPVTVGPVATKPRVNPYPCRSLGVTDLIVKAGIYGRLSHTRVVPNAAVVYSNTFFVHILNAWLDGLSMLILEISRLS